MLNKAYLVTLQILQHKTISAHQGYASVSVFGTYSRELEVSGP